MREDGKLKGKKERVTRKECKRLREEFEVGGFMAQKGLCNIATKRMLEDRGALPREDGDLLREYQAMHEENFLSSWLGKDVEGKEEERKRLNEEATREESKSGKREVEGERERVEIKRRCVDRVSTEVSEDFSPISEVESVGNSFGFSVCACCAFLGACCDCFILECECGP